MRCCVPGCKNDSRNISKSQGITFHVFPNKPSLRTAWLRAIGKLDWKPKERCSVCSDHFLYDDLYEKHSGLRKVRSGAVPVVLQNVSCDFGDSARQEVCRICLTTDSRMYAMKKYKLHFAYEHLTGVSLNEDKLPQSLCAECAHRLLAFRNFRSKSLRANGLLDELVRTQQTVTIQNLKLINRQIHQLVSSLSYKHFTPDHCDSYLEHTDEPIEIIDLDLEIKNELDIFEEEYVQQDIGEEMNGEEAVDEEAELAEDDADQDFAVSDKGFSSDDSLPLERSRTKKKAKDTPIIPSRQRKEKKVKEKKYKEKKHKKKSDEKERVQTTRREKEHKTEIPPITGPFVCLAPSASAGGTCQQTFSSCCEYSAHVGDEHARRRGARSCQVCEKPLAGGHNRAYSCKVCGAGFDLGKSLLKHQKLHEKKSFGCRVCDKQFTLKGYLQQHMRVHTGDRPYKCEYCEKSFTQKSGLDQHVRIHTKLKPYRCIVCSKTFCQSVHLQQHMRTHTQVSPFQCVVCQKRFKQYNHLKHHLDTHIIVSQMFSNGGHTGVPGEANTSILEVSEVSNEQLVERGGGGDGTEEVYYQEELGEETIEDEKKLPSDDDEDNISCRICSKTFASEVALRNHARMEHVEAFLTGDESLWKEVNEAEDTPEGVNIPSRKRKAEKEKAEKERAQTSRREKEKEKEIQPITGPFECFQPSAVVADWTCHQIFFSCCEYSAHFRNKHARRRKMLSCQVCEKPLAGGETTAPFSCEVCGAGFEANKDLSNHMATDHVKLKPFACSVCHKRFTQQGGVQEHMRMHTGDRPFACTFCPKAFTRKSGLDQHLRIHTKVKPYRCVVCSKTFCQLVHLRQHMRTHTQVSPFQCGICQKRFKQSSHLNKHLKNHNQLNMTDSQKTVYHKLMTMISNNGQSVGAANMSVMEVTEVSNEQVVEGGEEGELEGEEGTEELDQEEVEEETIEDEVFIEKQYEHEQVLARGASRSSATSAAIHHTGS